MKMTENGLGRWIYSEWLIPVKDYYCSISRNEAIFEVFLPFLSSCICSIIYLHAGKVHSALRALSELLPTAISILIGFTVMLITLLLTSNGSNVAKLKETSIEKKLYGKCINLHQLLHIQFSHSLVAEIVLLLLIFVYLFLGGLGLPTKVSVVFLTVEIHLTLNILLSILRGITNLYFSFYRTDTSQESEG